MNKQILEKYAALKKTEAETKLALAELNPLVIEEIKNEGGDKVVSKTLGTFTLTPLKKWVYSSEYEKAKEDLKVLKEKEEANGVATYTEELSLRFKAPKKDEDGE